MKNKLFKNTLFSLLVIGMFFSLAVPIRAAGSVVPLNDRVLLTTYSNIAVDDNSDINDYMLSGNNIYTSMGETFYADDGETAAGTGTNSKT